LKPYRPHRKKWRKAADIGGHDTKALIFKQLIDDLTKGGDGAQTVFRILWSNGDSITISFPKLFEDEMRKLLGGRGYMAIGIVVFASWKPERALFGAFLFAAIEVAAYRLQVMSTGVPYQFFLMLPFIAILIIMIVFKKHVEFPASIGEAYSRE
jgi:simple sugar transport system permease protein